MVVPLGTRTKAIRLPSGDQLGVQSSSGVDVSRRVSIPETNFTQMSLLGTAPCARSSPSQQNATCCASGENEA